MTEKFSVMPFAPACAEKLDVSAIPEMVCMVKGFCYPRHCKGHSTYFRFLLGDMFELAYVYELDHPWPLWLNIQNIGTLKVL